MGSNSVSIILTLLILIQPVVIFFAIKAYIKKRKYERLNQTVETPKNISTSRKYFKQIFVVAIIAIAILPFHYYFGDSGFRVFAKNNLTFSYTFVTQNDIEKVITRYDNASLFEKQSIRNEPFVRKLMEEGLLVEKGIFDK